MLRVPTFAAGLLVVAALAGCTSAPSAAPSVTPTPIVTAAAVRTSYGFVGVALNDTAMESVDRTNRGLYKGDYSCAAPAGFTDIAEGGQVTITDPDGEVVATASLGSGSSQGNATRRVNDCIFPFVASDVPMGLKFYGIHVGNTFRGILQFSEEQIRIGPILTIG